MKYREITTVETRTIATVVAYGCPNCDFQTKQSWIITSHVLENHPPPGVVRERGVGDDADDWYLLTQESDAKFFKEYSLVEAYDWAGAGWYTRIERPDDGPHADPGDKVMTFVAASELLKEVNQELEAFVARRHIIANYATRKD